MRFHDDITELIVELVADINDIGNEKIWAFYEEHQGEKIYVDYRFKNTPEDKMPKGVGQEEVEEILAKELLEKLKQQRTEEVERNL